MSSASLHLSSFVDVVVDFPLALVVLLVAGFLLVFAVTVVVILVTLFASAKVDVCAKVCIVVSPIVVASVFAFIPVVVFSVVIVVLLVVVLVNVPVVLFFHVLLTTRSSPWAPVSRLVYKCHHRRHHGLHFENRLHRQPLVMLQGLSLLSCLGLPD